MRANPFDLPESTNRTRAIHHTHTHTRAGDLPEVNMRLVVAREQKTRFR
jgi:hypothetical protein